MSRAVAAIVVVLGAARLVSGAPVAVHQARDLARRGDARGLLDLVRERYASLQSIAVTGESVTRMAMMGRKMLTTTKYVARVTHEGRYLVRWDAPVMTVDGQAAPGVPAAVKGGGAVWNDGTGAFNYSEMPAAAWAKASSDDLALSMATGVSGGATEIVLLVRGTASSASLSSIESPVLEDPEKVDGTSCWVVSGSTPASARQVVWISRSQLLVRRLSRSMAPPPGRELPQMEGSIDDAMRQAGLEPTPEARRRFEMMMEMAKVMQKHAGALDGEMTQTFRVDAVDRAIAQADLAFEPPAGTPFKRSLLEGIFDAPAVP